MTSSADEVVRQTENFLKQFLKNGHDDKEGLAEEGCAIIRAVKQLAENWSKEKQHAAAVQLHVDQLEKIIARLRSERDVTISPGGSGRPAKLTILESELDNLQIQLEQANDKVVLLSGIVEEKDTIIAQLQDELEQRTSELNTSCQALLDTRDQISSVDSSFVQLDARIKELDAENEGLRQQIAAMEANFASFQEEASEKAGEMQSELAQKQAALTALTLNSANEIAAYQDILEQFNVHMSSGISMFATHISDSLGSIDRGNLRLANLQQSLQLVQSALADRDNNLNLLASELQSKEATLQSSLNDNDVLQQTITKKDKELAMLEKRIVDVENDLLHASHLKTEVESVLALKEEDLARARQNLEDAQAKIEMLSEGFDTVSEKLEYYKDVHEKFQLDLDAEKSSRSQVEYLLKERDQLLSQASNEISDLKVQLAAYEAKIATYEATATTANSEVQKEGEEEELHRKILELERVIADKNFELEQLRLHFDAERGEWDAKHQQETDILKHELDTFQSKIREVDQLLPELHFQLTEAHRTKFSLAEKCEELQSSMAEKLELINKFKSEVAESEGKLSAAVGESDRLHQHCDSLQSKLELLTQQLLERNSEVDELGDRVVQLEKELEFARAQLTSADSDTANQLASLDRAKRELESALTEELKQKVAMQESLDSAEDSLREKTGEVDELRSRLSHATSDIERLSTDIRSASGELQRLQVLLDQRSLSAEAVSGEVAELQNKLERESNVSFEARTQNQQLQERLNTLSDELSKSQGACHSLAAERDSVIASLRASTDQNRFYEAELGRLGSAVASFAQFIDSRLAYIWSRLDMLTSRVFSLQGSAQTLVQSHRFSSSLLHDIRSLVQTWAAQQGPLFAEFASAVLPALDKMEARVSVAQNSFSQLTEQITKIRANASSVEKSLRGQIAQLSDQLTKEHSQHNRPVAVGYCQTSACLVDISEVEALQDVLDRRDAELDQLTKDVKRLSHRPVRIECETQTVERLVDPAELVGLQSSVVELERQIANRDEQLKSFSDELQVLHSERTQLLNLEQERQLQSVEINDNNNKVDVSDGSTETDEPYHPPEEVHQLEASLQEALNRLGYCEQQLHSANQQIQGLVEEVKSYRDAAKRAERRFGEADAAAKSMAADSQNMAAIVQNLREKLRSSEEKLAATEIARVQVTNQLVGLQAAYASMPKPEQSAEVEAECDRLRNKVKFMTDQFELAVSRSALLERSLREKDEQCERLARELGSERQRAMAFEKESTPPSSGLPSPARDSPLSHTRVDLRQYYDALPVPVKRAFDRVRHSQAAAVTLSASQRFHRIVDQLPVTNSLRQFSISARHRIMNRLSPAKLQFIVTVYVTFLHLLTIFYMFTCYGPPIHGAIQAPPHLEQPEDM